MKIRVTQSFRDAISEARRVFGTDGNNTSSISRRAVRSFSKEPFAFSRPNDKTVGNPVTIKVNWEYDLKDFQGIVIAYVNNQIEKTSSRRSVPLVLDESKNYIIEN